MKVYLQLVITYNKDRSLIQNVHIFYFFPVYLLIVLFERVDKALNAKVLKFKNTNIFYFVENQ